MTVAEKEETTTYLTFVLGTESFGVDVRNVREVLDFTTITRVPRMPEFMRGVINLRGSVVPVIDMRLKFGMEKAEDTVDTCVIVMEISLDGETTVVGALSDAVKEVFDLDASQIEPPPRIGTSLNTEFIRGMGKHDEEFIIILDIDRVFSAEELALVAEERPEGETLAGVS
jgi:purine-binding chemotaxis protein CheW